MSGGLLDARGVGGNTLRSLMLLLSACNERAVLSGFTVRVQQYRCRCTRACVSVH